MPPPAILPSVTRSGRDAVALRRAAAGDAEAGHHLVEDEHRAVPGAALAQAVEEAVGRRHAAHVADHRLDDHRGDAARRLGEAAIDAGQIVEAGDRACPPPRRA